MNTTQFRPDYFFYFLWSKGQNFFPTLGGQIIYFIYKNCQTPLPAESIGCPQNKPGNKRTKIWNGWCQNNGDKLCTKYFFIFFSDNSKCFHRIGFEMYILIIMYTVCEWDTLVPMEDFKFWDFLVLFQFPQMGPRVLHYYWFQCFCPVFRINWLSQNEIHCSW